MCLILIKPKNATNYLTFERFCNALDNNPHSVGICYLNDNNELEIRRYVNPTKGKRDIYDMIKDREQYAIHFRYATHGAIDLSNCHPFKVSDDLILMHNGVMSDFGKIDTNKSDTRNFCDSFLAGYIKSVGSSVINDEDFKADMLKIIGSYNKLLLIDKDFNFSIINEKAGVWREGCWLSNGYSTDSYSSYYQSYYKDPSKAPTATTTPSTTYNHKKDYMYGEEWDDDCPWYDSYGSSESYDNYVAYQDALAKDAKDNAKIVDDIMAKINSNDNSTKVTQVMNDPFSFVDSSTGEYFITES